MASGDAIRNRLNPIYPSFSAPGKESHQGNASVDPVRKKRGLNQSFLKAASIGLAESNRQVAGATQGCPLRI
jgi:hypothetical protein